MKRILFFFLLISNVALAQKPSWIMDEERFRNYPREQYLTGFAVNAGQNSAGFMNRLKAAAKSELIENIQVSVQSLKEQYKSENDGSFSEEFVASTRTFADADINGLKIEYYYDNAAQMGYVFAYANKNEVQDYYKAKIAFLIKNIENTINSARQLEVDGNKGRARKMYEEISSPLKELSFAQSLLIAIGSDDESLQIEKSLAMKSEITKAIVHMQSAIAVYIKSDEVNFGQPVKLLEPKLKAALSQHGCSFTPKPDKSDWRITIEASTRKGAEIEGLCFAYLDVEVSLVESKTGKEIYSNNFSDLKGGGLDYKTAGRKAYDTNLQSITDEIIKYLEK
jgi:hypothetical protein